MSNKIIVGILVVLAVFSGGLGYYSFSLNQQVASLSGQLAAFQQQQIASIDAVNNGLTDLKRETQQGVSSLDSKVNSALTQVDSVEGEVSGALDSIATLAGETKGTQDRLGALEDQIGGATAALSQSVINASDVYSRIRQASVMVGNGDNTVFGSGFVYDGAGHVVTAHHVVEGLSQIYVTMADGRVTTASSVSSNEASDIAVLTLNVAPAVAAPPLGDSGRLTIGEPVITIGNPFGLTATLTSGIVSQTNRYVQIQNGSQNHWVANLIQFDAAVNPGNSGGLLANAAGDIIGMVIARVSADQGDGIYYAVSSNKISRVVPALIAHGFYDYPWIGVSITDLTPQTVQSKGLDTDNGALVMAVVPGGPAEAAGIKVGDVLTAIDGIDMGTTADLTSYLGEHKSPGDTAAVSLIRNGTGLDLLLQVGKLAG